MLVCCDGSYPFVDSRESFLRPSESRAVFRSSSIYKIQLTIPFIEKLMDKKTAQRIAVLSRLGYFITAFLAYSSKLMYNCDRTKITRGSDEPAGTDCKTRVE